MMAQMTIQFYLEGAKKAPSDFKIFKIRLNLKSVKRRQYPLLLGALSDQDDVWKINNKTNDYVAFLFCKEPELYKSTIASNGYCINENL
jgi:hypothetical protein